MRSVFQKSKTASPNLLKSLWVFVVMCIFVFVSHTQSVGSRILFTSVRDGNVEVYTMNPDGSNPVNLSRHPGSDMYPVWSADGKRIAFISDRDGNREISVVDANGGRPIQLTHTPPPVSVYRGCVWSPDGTQIAFNSNREGNMEVYVMDDDGKNLMNLSLHLAIDTLNGWSPDGRQTLFTSRRDGNLGIYVVDTNGGKPRLFIRNGYYVNRSPDGRQILFTSWPDGVSDIYIMDADGGNPQNVTRNPARDTQASWSQNGRQILFSSTRDDPLGEIYVMNRNGGNVVRLTHNQAGDAPASWFDPFFPVSEQKRLRTLWGALKGKP